MNLMATDVQRLHESHCAGCSESDMHQVRLTFHEWNAIRPNGIEVLDPDGWNRRDPTEFTERKYTREEWLERAFLSTVIHHMEAE